MEMGIGVGVDVAAGIVLPVGVRVGFLVGATVAVGVVAGPPQADKTRLTAITIENKRRTFFFIIDLNKIPFRSSTERKRYAIQKSSLFLSPCCEVWEQSLLANVLAYSFIKPNSQLRHSAGLTPASSLCLPIRGNGAYNFINCISNNYLVKNQTEREFNKDIS